VGELRSGAAGTPVRALAAQYRSCQKELEAAEVAGVPECWLPGR
jgi:hypothetical protein